MVQLVISSISCLAVSVNIYVFVYYCQFVESYTCSSILLKRYYFSIINFFIHDIFNECSLFDDVLILIGNVECIPFRSVYWLSLYVTLTSIICSVNSDRR